MMMLASQAFLFRRLSLAVAPSFMTLSRDASGPLTRETPLPSETRDFDALLALLEPGVSPSLLPQPAQPPNLVPGGKEAIRSPSDPVPLVDSDAPPADPDPPADPSPSPATSAPFDAVADDGAVAGAEEGEEGDEEALAPDWSDLERGVWEEIMRRSGRHAAVLASCCRVLKAAFDWLVAKEDLTSSWPHISRETGLMRAPANFYAEVGPADDLQATIDGAPLDACIRLFKGRHVLKWQLYMPTVHLFGSKQGTTLVVDFAEGPVCNTWVFRGSCPRGATCSYTHTAVLPPQTCKYHYFLDAGCKHGDNCWFAESHSWPTYRQERDVFHVQFPMGSRGSLVDLHLHLGERELGQADIDVGSQRQASFVSSSTPSPRALPLPFLTPGAMRPPPSFPCPRPRNTRPQGNRVLPWLPAAASRPARLRFKRDVRRLRLGRRLGRRREARGPQRPWPLRLVRRPGHR